MVARVTHVKVKPEDVAEAVRLFDESVIPAAEQEEGFMGALLLTRKDGRALVVDLCDSIEHMRDNERSGVYQTEVAKLPARSWTGRRASSMTSPSPRAFRAVWSCCAARTERVWWEARH